MDGAYWYKKDLVWDVLNVTKIMVNGTYWWKKGFSVGITDAMANFSGRAILRK